MNVLCNLLILALESIGLVGILAGHEKGKLLEHGLNCLKYYTVLSNLMAWLVVVSTLVSCLLMETTCLFPPGWPA